MSLVSDITTICNTLYPNSSFILASQFKANVEVFDLENSNFPVIILDNELSTDEEIQPNAHILSRNKIVMTFLNKDDFDTTDAQSEAIVEVMRLYARRVFVNIYKLSKIRLKKGTLQKFKLTPVFKVSNSILSGVIGVMEASEDLTVNWCLTP